MVWLLDGPVPMRYISRMDFMADKAIAPVVLLSFGRGDG